MQCSTYRELVNRTAEQIPNFELLKEFLDTHELNSLSCETTLLEFEENNGNFTSKNVAGGDLGAHLKHDNTKQLLLVQNITPSVLESIGAIWQVPLDFFQSHLENFDWYRQRELQFHLPTLRSVRDKHVRFQFVGLREIKGDLNGDHIALDIEGAKSTILRGSGGFTPTEPPSLFKLKGRTASGFPQYPSDENTRADPTLVKPKLKQAASLRSRPPGTPSNRQSQTPDTRASNEPPRSPPPQPLKPINESPREAKSSVMKPALLIRNSITAWFDKDDCEEKWSKGIILFDPPFEPAEDPSKNQIKLAPEHGKPIYKSFIRRSLPLHYNQDEFDDRNSYKDSYLNCLRIHLKAMKLKETPHVSLLLQDVCRIVASEWLVCNAFFARELNTIERWFETYAEDCPKDDLHYLLVKLMEIRRRVIRYDTLLREQLHIGPDTWDHSSIQTQPNQQNHTLSHPVSDSCVQFPLKDFFQVLEHFSLTKARLSQSTDVAASFMSINQNDLSEKRNRNLGWLTVITNIFLPATAIAAIMTMPSEHYLTSEDHRWSVYWIAASLCSFLPAILFAMIAASDFFKEKWTKRERAVRDSKMMAWMSGTPLSQTAAVSANSQGPLTRKPGPKDSPV